MYFRIALCSALISACSSTMPQTETSMPERDTDSVSQHTTGTQPDTERLIRHFEAHVKYPANRAAVLAACASTPEFTADEKQWTREHLPEGTYENAEQTRAALGI